MFLRLMIYITLAFGITHGNDNDGQKDESDIIENIKRSNGFAVLTHSVTYQEITEDYTEFENKLTKRETILETEPHKLAPIYDPQNLKFDRDFDRGRSYKHSSYVFNYDDNKY